MITIHHLDNSRSQRILWLLEELDLEYVIKRYRRGPHTSGRCVAVASTPTRDCQKRVLPRPGGGHRPPGSLSTINRPPRKPCFPTVVKSYCHG